MKLAVILTVLSTLAAGAFSQTATSTSFPTTAPDFPGSDFPGSGSSFPGSGGSSLPACKDDITNCAKTTSTGADGAVTCGTGCHPCKVSAGNDVTKDVCIPDNSQACSDNTFGDVEITFDDQNCPVFGSSGAAGRLNSTCTEAMGKAYTEQTSSECVALEGLFADDTSSSSSSSAPTESDIKALCTNPCLWRMIKATQVMSKVCPLSALKNSEGQNQAAFMAKSMNLFCRKNENGNYCGAELAKLDDLGRKRRAGALSTTGSTHDIVRAFVRKAIESTQWPLQTPKNLRALQDSGGAGIELDCSQVEQAKAQFDQLKAQLGCCFGELFGLMIDPEVVGTDSSFMVVIIEALKKCGLDFGEKCVLKEATAAKLKAKIAIKVKNFTEEKKEEFKQAVREDIATNHGIDVERVTITKFEVKTRRATGSDAELDVEFEILAHDSAELETIKSEIDTKGAGGYELSNTDVASGGDGSGASASVATAPEVEEITPAADEEASSSSTVTASVAAVATAASVAFLL